MNKLANERKPMEERKKKDTYTQSETGTQNAIADKQNEKNKKKKTAASNKVDDSSHSNKNETLHFRVWNGIV